MFPAMVVRPLKLCSSCMYQASLKFSLFFSETAVTTNMPRLSDLVDVVVSTKRISNAKDHSAKLPSGVLTLFGKMFFQYVSRPVVEGTCFPCHSFFYLLTYDSMILAVTHISAEFSSLIDNFVIEFFSVALRFVFELPAGKEAWHFTGPRGSLS